jgi:hypothetical protein
MIIEGNTSVRQTVLHEPEPAPAAAPPRAPYTPPQDGVDAAPARFDAGEPVPPPTLEDLESKAAGRPAGEVNVWWKSLSAEQREKAIQDRPDLVGWMDGVPATDRDRANRVMLGRHGADLQRQEDEAARRLADIQANPGTNPEQHAAAAGRAQADLETIQTKRRELEATENKLNSLGNKGLLLGIDPAGDGKAIISMGNPDTARHTAVWVPGLGTELGDTGGNVNRVKNLQEAADGLTTEENDVAGIMWLGYDAPETDLSVVKSDRSREGGKAFDSFVNGLRASHEGGPHHITAVGHSYGSTVVAEAALEGDGLAVDDIVTAGSPGMHTDKAGNLQINGSEDHKHVWAGSAKNDPVSDPGGHKWLKWAPGVAWAVDKGHGESPHTRDFGGNRYHVDTEGHSDYWKAGSQSVNNQAHVVVGQYSGVGLDHGEKPPEWVG